MAVSRTSTAATLTYSRSILWLYWGRSESGATTGSVSPASPASVSTAPVSAAATSSLVSSTCVLMGVTSGRYQVDEREDDDPHDVDEVPVEADDVDDLRPVPVDAAPQRDNDQRYQHADAR